MKTDRNRTSRYGAPLSAVLAAAALTLGCGDGAEPLQPTQAICGDGVVEAGELCDATALAGASCQALGFTSGALRCAASCAGWIVAECEGLGQPLQTGLACGACGTGEVCQDGLCVAACGSGAEVLQSGRRDFDLEVVDLRVQLALGGEPVPEGARGSLFFRDVLSGYGASVELPEAGTAEVQLPLYTGTYQVEWHHPGGQAVEGLPATSQIVESALEVEAGSIRGAVPLDLAQGEPLREEAEAGPEASDSRQEIDESGARWSGELTVNGEPLPQGAEASLHFISLEPGLSHQVEISARGTVEAPDFATHLEPGRYRVEVSTAGGGAPQALPQGRYVVMPELEVPEEGGRHDLDLRVVRLHGEILVGGAQMPDNGVELAEGASTTRGSLHLIDLDDPTLVTHVDLGPAGAARYDVALFPGRYRVELQGRFPSAQDSIPPLNQPIEQALEVGADATRDFDVEVVTLQGELTLNGQPMPETEQVARGKVMYSEARPYWWFYQPEEPLVPATGAANYKVKVYRGARYGVWFQSFMASDVLPSFPTMLGRRCQALPPEES